MIEKAEPFVVETHGGVGLMYERLYKQTPNGAVFERDRGLAHLLAEARPSWRVYENDCAAGLANGAAADVAVDVLDADPFGDPWPALSAFFQSERRFADRMAVVVNDGLRQGLGIVAWKCRSVQEEADRFGGRYVFDNYLEISRSKIARLAQTAGFRIERMAGEYAGHALKMTHWAALLIRL